MARIRTIKPEFWTDEKVVELSAFARLLFIGIWNFCDDEGRMVYSPKRIKMQIFPADAVDIAALFVELTAAGLVQVYAAGDAEYLQVRGFARHQKIDKRSPSRLPAPSSPAEFSRLPPPEGKGMERRGEDAEADASDAAAPAVSPAVSPTVVPAFSSKDELWAAGKSLLEAAGLPAKQCGSFVGKLAKDYGSEVAIEAVRAAVLERPADPVGYLKATCLRMAGLRRSAVPWYATEQGVLAKGAEFALTAYPGESMTAFKARIEQAMSAARDPPGVVADVREQRSRMLKASLTKCDG